MSCLAVEGCAKCFLAFSAKCALRYVSAQEEDVIGVLPVGEKISHLKPLSDRVLIKVGAYGRALCLQLAMHPARILV